MPSNTFKVDRSTRWGNPFVATAQEDRAQCVQQFERYCSDPQQAAYVAAARAELRGKNLACWCPLEGPCHADTLLSLVNSDDQRKI